MSTLPVTRVELHPKVRFAPGTDTRAGALASIHHSAHESCFIALSVNTVVTVLRVRPRRGAGDNSRASTRTRRQDPIHQ